MKNDPNKVKKNTQRKSNFSDNPITNQDLSNEMRYLNHNILLKGI